MKYVISFLKATAIGGILFLIPFFIVLITVIKAIEISGKIIEPLIIKLGIQHFAGKATVTIVVILISITICVLIGLFVRSGRIPAHFPAMDAIAIKLIPGYEILKAKHSETSAATVQNPWKAIYLKIGEHWCIAFIVEQNDTAYSTVFIPQAPKLESGEVKLINLQSTEFLPITVTQAHTYLGKFGAGAAEVLNDLKPTSG